MCCECCKNLMASSLNDLKDPQFWRGVVAEVLGTLFLVFIGCGACIGKDWADYTPTQVQISLCFGLVVATVVWCIGHVSGGHINPAVTVGMLVARKISIVRAVLFVSAQCGGAIAGSAMLKVLTPVDLQGNLGTTTVDGALSVEQGFGVELMITFLLVFTVFASCDSARSDLNGSAPLTIGLSVAVGHLFAIKYTGSSMNPARTFGPAVVTGSWDHHWVYWCGPLCGGVIAALLYETVFAADASATKVKYFLLSNRAADQPARSVANVENQASPEELAKMREAEDRDYQASPKELEKMRASEDLVHQALPKELAKMREPEDLVHQASPKELAKMMESEDRIYKASPKAKKREAEDHVHQALPKAKKRESEDRGRQASPKALAKKRQSEDRVHQAPLKELAKMRESEDSM